MLIGLQKMTEIVVNPEVDVVKVSFGKIFNFGKA